MALIRATSGGSSSTTFESVLYTIPANGTTAVFNLTKNKVPKYVFMSNAGQFITNINYSSNTVSSTQLYNLANNLTFTMSITSTKITVSGINSSSQARSARVYVIYE